MYRRQKEGCKGKPKSTNGKCGNSKTDYAFPFHAEEVEEIEKACNVTADMHITAMKVLRPGMYEYEVVAEMNISPVEYRINALVA